MFPWRKQNKKELLYEYANLKDRLLNISKASEGPVLKYIRVGMKCSNIFFQKERLKTRSQNKISCFDFWKLNKEKIVKYNSKNKSHDLFTTIVFMNHAPSQFPPMTAGMIYKYFGATKILDPYAGWGDRCIAAMAMNINYIGIDSNPKLINSYNRMINYFPTLSSIKIISDKSENINLNKLDFDFILSSPPFWNTKKTRLLEEYNNTSCNYENFINNSIIHLIKTVWKKDPNIWICLHIPTYMYKDIIKILGIGSCKKIIKFLTTLNTTKKQYIYCF
jgi:tRNA1(Val) A37 N6-methylase TrmN6